jgi:hypothetical protein
MLRYCAIYVAVLTLGRMDSLFRPARRRRIGTCLIASALALLALTGNAHAAADGGWKETNTSLAIVPDATPYEIGIADNSTVMVVRMPVTKRINRVTLGDLRQIGCADPDAKLRIHYYGDADPLEAPSLSSFESSSKPALPTLTSKVTWDFATSVTLLKGKTYAFKIDADSCTGWKIKQTTWPNGDQVDPGADSLLCAMSGTTAALRRGWHKYDESVTNPCAAWNWSPSMPDGWHVVKPCAIGTCKEIVVRDFTGTQQATGECAGSGAGGRWAYWYTSGDSRFYVCTWTQYKASGSRAMPPESRGWHYAVPWPPLSGGGTRDMYMVLETIDYGALIQNHAPKLFYNEGENYYVASAQSMIDWGLNTLERWVDTVFPPQWMTMADHDLNSPPDNLSIDVLGAQYPGSWYPLSGDPRSDDRLNQGGDPQVASDQMRVEGHGDKIYGRVVYGPSGKLWIQYWFWYYYNDLAPVFGTHEGDWEMIQVGFTDNLTPDVVTYSVHEGAESCNDFEYVRVSGTSSPGVYVGRGSHASYMDPGEDNVNGAADKHWGDLEGAPQPSTIVVTGELSTFWGWPGQWGDGGPAAPRRQEPKWSNPDQFHADADPYCNLSGARTKRGKPRREAPTQTRPLAVPKIHAASRKGSRATVRYSVARPAQARERLYVEVTVKPSNPRNPARTEYRRLTPGKHDVRVLLPLGGGPYRVEARVVDRRNRYGRSVSRRLP